VQAEAFYVLIKSAFVGKKVLKIHSGLDGGGAAA
jgi:hypothetical protein